MAPACFGAIRKWVTRGLRQPQPGFTSRISAKVSPALTKVKRWVSGLPPRTSPRSARGRSKRSSARTAAGRVRKTIKKTRKREQKRMSTLRHRNGGGGYLFYPRRASSLVDCLPPSPLGGEGKKSWPPASARQSFGFVVSSNPLKC